MRYYLAPRRLLAAAAALLACAAHAQMPGYWADGSGAPVRSATGECMRSSSWSTQTLHPACDAMPAPKMPDRVMLLPAPKAAQPDRVVLLPGPDGKVGAVIVQSKQGQQLVNSAFGALAVGKDGKLTASVENAAAVQSRYGEVLGIRPARPVSFVVRFASGSATSLTPESLPVLNEAKRVFQSRAAPEVTVIGHTDRVGSVPANDALSLRRAQAVRQMLLDAGLDASTITAAGRGEREPLVPTADEVAEPRNRRVEIDLR